MILFRREALEMDTMTIVIGVLFAVIFIGGVIISYRH